MIPSGMMSLGNTYRVAFVGYEPYQGPEALKASVWETAKTFSIYKNATKFSPIKLAKSPVSSLTVSYLLGSRSLQKSSEEIRLWTQTKTSLCR